MTGQSHHRRANRVHHVRHGRDARAPCSPTQDARARRLPIETDFGGGAVRDNPQLNSQLASLAALGRVGLPDDVGGAVAALLSEGNGWITGQRIEVSGGTLL
jgi:NAD(P)-dependent dehydrogenase (short-subunit alcohol dehydrogenase family)